MAVGVGSRSNVAGTIKAEMNPAGSVPVSTVGWGADVGTGTGDEVGAGVEVATGTDVAVGDGAVVAVGGCSVGVGGTDVAVGAGVGIGVDVGGTGVGDGGGGTRVAVAGTDVAVAVGCCCCDSAVAVGAVVDTLVVGAMVPLEEHPDMTSSVTSANAVIGQPGRIFFIEFVITVFETTRSQCCASSCQLADMDANLRCSCLISGGL